MHRAAEEDFSGPAGAEPRDDVEVFIEEIVGVTIDDVVHGISLLSPEQSRELDQAIEQLQAEADGDGDRIETRVATMLEELAGAKVVGPSSPKRLAHPAAWIVSILAVVLLAQAGVSTAEADNPPSVSAEVRVAAEHLDFDRISEAAYNGAIDWLANGQDELPVSADPESACGEWEIAVTEAGERAVRAEGFDLADPQVVEAAFDGIQHARDTFSGAMSYAAFGGNGEDAGVARAFDAARHVGPRARVAELLDCSVEELQEALVAVVRWGMRGSEPSDRLLSIESRYDDLYHAAASPERAHHFNVTTEDAMAGKALRGAILALEHEALVEAQAREQKATVVDSFRGHNRLHLGQLGHRWTVRSRERSSGCTTRSRGSRRSLAVPSADDPGGDPEPGLGPAHQLDSPVGAVCLSGLAGAVMS